MVNNLKNEGQSMTEYENQRLCGGIFFVLLQQAKNQRTSARKKTCGDTDGLSDPDMLAELIRVAYPEYEEAPKDSFKTITSSYKSCRVASSAYLPFKKVEIQSAFDEQIKHNYNQALFTMSKFTKFFLDGNRMGYWLVIALLELIESDSSIDADELFYIEDDGTPICKSSFHGITDIKFQSFLLGIWHYIITKRPDNKVGQTTYENWHKKAITQRAPREFVSNIGKKSGLAIQLNILDLLDEEKTAKTVPSDFGPNIAPELTGVPPLLVLPGEMYEPTGEFSNYLQNAHEKYCSIKTLLYSDHPRKFYDFYVCNTVYQKINLSSKTYKQKTIYDATASSLSDCSNFVILSGTGGLGKSMMMRHLLLGAIENYKENGRIPFFIPLKDFDESFNGLLEYVYKKFDTLGGGIELEEFEELLCNGNCLLLFDGLDEISSSCRKQFERNLETFADKYSENMYVISSRPFGPFGNYVSFNRFTVLHLQPFSKDQALELIDKLDFRSDEPAIKANFRKELKKSLYNSHREFTQNPLLLTIMLMTYELFAEVPSKMHVFYHEAYLALSQKHDASKGAFKRALKTGLTADKFSDYFAEFCARTYRNEKFELTEIEFEKYFENLTERKKDNLLTDASDFIYDLTSNMCLMYYESGKYHFTHRSFQEYFCALYFSKQKDKNLQRIGDFFENKRSRTYGDKTFSMLYDMIPEKVKEYIFTPFLTNLFNRCDNGNGYWTFLETMYPVLYYDIGDVTDSDYNTPSSFIYNFIIKIKQLYETIENGDFPFYEEFVIVKYGYYNESWHYFHKHESWELINKDEIDAEYFIFNDVPETEGWNFEFDINSIIEQKEDYEELLDVLNDNGFALKKEYHKVRKYLEKLLKEHITTGADLFDFF